MSPVLGATGALLHGRPATGYYPVTMSFRFSLKTSATCALLAASMLGMSAWQWTRHLEKQSLISTLHETLTLAPVSLAELITGNPDWGALSWRRVKLSGSFDFEHEFLLRNRSFDGRAGVHVITPLLIDGAGDVRVLVDRGFIPLGREGRTERERYQRPAHAELYGLIKQSVSPKLLAPNDPEPVPGGPWVDQWLRVDIGRISRQLPYRVLPVYLETMKDPNDPLLPSQILKASEAGRHDVLNMAGQSGAQNFGMDSPEADYPVPAYDTTPPPDIHLGYVYEWAFIALITLLIGAVLQMRRPRGSAGTPSGKDAGRRA